VAVTAGFRIRDSGFGIQDSGFGIQESEEQGLGARDWGKANAEPQG
jgi:hypothetical protein